TQHILLKKHPYYTLSEQLCQHPVLTVENLSCA
ncbi:unnamed protein product, partial [marine sediment metagenome]